jgi:hypothetical protein
VQTPKTTNRAEPTRETIDCIIGAERRQTNREEIRKCPSKPATEDGIFGISLKFFVLFASFAVELPDSG